MWMDRSKTLLLNVLIGISLVMSWLLLNSQPKYEVLYPAEYVEQKPMGDKRELKDLVKPKAIIFHFGNRYTKAIPDTVYYQFVQREMEKWYFFNFSTVNLTDEKWNEVMHQKKAIEIVYPDEIPVDVMQEMFTFRGKVDTLITSVQRIIVYEDDLQQETYTLFINKDGTKMVQARTAVTSRDLDNFYLSLGSSQEEQFPFALSSKNRLPIIYLPKERQTMKEYQYFYQPIPVFQMIQTLFVDPSITRQVTERDGSTIYTDGSKAVQIPSDMRSIHFHDPRSESYSADASESRLTQAIRFINEHGGWNGNYMLQVAEKLPSNEENYQFRLYVNYYPVYGPKGEMIGSVEVNNHQNVVTGFHRSLIQVDTDFNHQDVQVKSGEDILQELSHLGVFMGEVEDIFLGYQALINDYHVTLSPRWIITLTGRDPLIINAISTENEEGEGDLNGLEKSENHPDTSVPSTR